MATKPRQTKPEESGVVGRLAGRGEDAVTRLMDTLGRNTAVTEALARAMSAKGRLDATSRAALAQVGLAAADEIKDLRGQLERLERRLAKVETTGGSRSGGSRSASGSRSGTSGGASSSRSGAKSSSGTRTKSSSSGTKSSGTSSKSSSGTKSSGKSSGTKSSSSKSS